MILNETFELFRTKYADQFMSTTIKRVNIGIMFTAVQLSSGYCGVASTDLGMVANCTKTKNKDFGEFSPGKIAGRKLIDLFSFNGGSKILDIVKLAALNAVSAELIENANYKIITDKDPIDLVELNSNKTVCIVGAFHSYMKNIAETLAKLIVLELNEDAIPVEYKKFYVPAAKAGEVFPEADVIIITGSTLVNNTLDEMLDIIPPDKQVIIVGPTASLIPDVLFKKGINIIGSTRILDADKVFLAIEEGGAGYHLFQNGAQKICLLNERK
jgi:uncharacterized protein (DUF4213/DUF364 family)